MPKDPMDAVLAMQRSMTRQQEELLNIFWQIPCKHRMPIEAEYREGTDWISCCHGKARSNACSIETCPLHREDK